MYAWAVKRRLIYGGIVLVFFLIIFSFIFWKYFYKAPTCFDGMKNGDEKGIDCGGGCKNLCTADTLSPVVLWSKIFNVSGDIYTAVAYIQNPNITSFNPNALYKFRVYDANKNVIMEKDGQTSIPKNKMFAVFETSLQFKGVKPKSVSFEFTNFSPWQKNTEPEPDLLVLYGTLEATTTSPRITGKITNNSLRSISSLELDVFVLDSKENVVAASRSFIDNLYKGTTQDFVFTWPKPFDLGVVECANPVDVILSLDRSGSMRSESKDPPEPFNTVLSTAADFVKNFGSGDQVGIVSFGTNSRLESRLLMNKDESVNSVVSMKLSSTSEQTNIAGGLSDAYTELLSSNARVGAKKAIILLTDGIPTEPTQPGVSDYPTVSAEQTADTIKSSGIDIYTIGLGKEINEVFLKKISTDDKHYFNAPNKSSLSNIYKSIGTGLCSRKPNVITVIYRSI
ncbi:MAG: VWA domain-containing protein [Minisyncoccia bacterium]